MDGDQEEQLFNPESLYNMDFAERVQNDTQ